MEMISVLQVIDMILWYYRGPKIAVAARETNNYTVHNSVSQSVRYIAVPPRSPDTTVSKDGFAPLGQHKY
jgi:hypothetical protein